MTNKIVILGRQYLLLLSIGIANFREKKWIALVIALSSAIAVIVLVGFLSAAKSYEAAVKSAGSDNVIIVTEKGATAEGNSRLSREQLELLNKFKTIKQTQNGQMFSGEIGLTANATKKSDGSVVNLTFRGMDNNGAWLRDGFTLSEGRMFRPSANEVIIGAALGNKYLNFDVGQKILISGVNWDIVGIFRLASAVPEHEIWTNISALQAVSGLENKYQSIRFMLESPDDFADLIMMCAEDSRLDLDIQTEKEFYKAQSSGVVNLVSYIAWPLAIILGLASAVSVFNIMLLVMRERRREFAILRQIGFSRRSIFFALLSEAAAYSIVGAILGVVASMIIFNGMSSVGLSEGHKSMSYVLMVDTSSAAKGLFLGFIIGVVAAIGPAYRAVNSKLIL